MLEREVEAHREAAQHEVSNAVKGVVRRQRQRDLVYVQQLSSSPTPR
jgi:hypothetical protein